MANVANLKVVSGGYEFSIDAGPKDFSRALASLKAIHWTGRQWNPERRRWFVAFKHREDLVQIFSNWDAAERAFQAQPVLGI